MKGSQLADDSHGFRRIFDVQGPKERRKQRREKPKRRRSATPQSGKSEKGFAAFCCL
jgi:hypothetical protein